MCTLHFIIFLARLFTLGQAIWKPGLVFKSKHCLDPNIIIGPPTRATSSYYHFYNPPKIASRVRGTWDAQNQVGRRQLVLPKQQLLSETSRILIFMFILFVLFLFSASWLKCFIGHALDTQSTAILYIRRSIFMQSWGGGGGGRFSKRTPTDERRLKHKT